jgi:hypothetical protein
LALECKLYLLIHHVDDHTVQTGQAKLQIFESWGGLGWDPSTVDKDDPLGIDLPFGLPKGYGFRILPYDAKVKPSNKFIKIQYSYNIPKIFIAIVQLIYAIVSLYHSRVHQIQRYGYAAFGLTVTPYAIMSFINLISFIFCPDFQELYLVRSKVLEEAVERYNVEKRCENGFERIQIPDIPVVGELIEAKIEPTDITESNSSRCWNGPKDKLVKVHFQGPGKNADSASIHVLPNGAEKQHEDDALSEPPQADFELSLVSDDVKYKDEFYKIRIPSNYRMEKCKHPLKMWRSKRHKHDDDDAEAAKEERDKEEIEEPEATRDILADMNRNFACHGKNIVHLLLTATVYGVIIGTIGWISRFREAESSLAQRIWTMLWQSVGLFWILIGLLIEYLSQRLELSRTTQHSLHWVLLMTCIAPAIGGFVVVGQMLRTFGTCTSL